jgi:hypothetical protein
MVLLHAGAPPSSPLALLALLVLATSIFITAAIISDFQRKAGPPAGKRVARRRSRRATPQSDG